MMVGRPGMLNPSGIEVDLRLARANEAEKCMGLLGGLSATHKASATAKQHQLRGGSFHPPQASDGHRAIEG